MTLAALNDWFMGLGAQYGVNPYIFGTLYVGSIPFFFVSLAWLVKRKRAGESAILPMLATTLCFLSAYIYLAFVGKNVPTHIWIILAAFVVYGGWSTVRDVKRKIAAGREADQT